MYWVISSEGVISMISRRYKMLTYITRKKLINEYFKWLSKYDLSHTPDTFLEWLLILEYIDEEKCEEDMEGLVL